MAVGDTIGVVLAPRPTRLFDLALHQLVHHAEPDTNAQREQTLLRSAHQLAEHLLRMLGQCVLPACGRRGGDLLCLYVLHGGPS